jgi:putative transposase
MAEAFVRTIKRDYVRVSPCPNAETVMHQLSSWINALQRGSPAQGSQISFAKDHFDMRVTAWLNAGQHRTPSAAMTI